MERKFKCIKDIRISVDYNTKMYEDYKIGDIVDEVEIWEGFEHVSLLEFKEHFQEITPAEDIVKNIITNYLDETNSYTRDGKEVYEIRQYKLYDNPDISYEVEVSKEEFDYIKKLKEEGNK